MSDWRPIETAPKDGTPILVWGKWDGEIGDWSKIPPSAGVAARWYDSWQPAHSDAYSCALLLPSAMAAVWCNATHWRPLPEPPAAQEVAPQNRTTDESNRPKSR